MPISRRAFAAGAARLGALAVGGSLQAARPLPTLLVWILLEGCRSDFLERNRAAFSKGGLRRLMDEGCYFPDCRMAASTFTAPGVATLATGTWPQLHGIVADTWYDTATRQLVRASPEALTATGLAEQITRDGKSRLFVVGLDDRYAALVAGPNPLAVFGMDQRGEFGVRGSAPMAWFGAFQRANPASNLWNAPWLALGARPESQPLRMLRYDQAHPQDFVFLYKSSPFAQSTQFELAREVILRESLGQGGGVDFLVLMPGSTSLLGYDVGADSPLIDQLMLNLDRDIEKLLELLAGRVDGNNCVVVLTAAHGGPPQPPPVLPRPAVSGEALVRTIEKALADRFKGVTVERYVYPFLYLKIPPTLDRRQVRVAAAQAALQAPGVAGYFTADGDCSHGGEWQRRFRNSFHMPRSGDAMLSYAPGWVEEFGTGRGLSYGSFYNYDVRVPLIFYGGPFRSRTYEEAVEAVDVAPTIARLTGLTYPSSSIGRVLGEAFQ
jgi:predicted AlkP superfamily pyrophosphatase or phosphodiesterase